MIDDEAMPKTLGEMLGLPDGAVLVKYGSSETFCSEGDMYEHITGHRSSVLDAKQNNRPEGS